VALLPKQSLTKLTKATVLCQGSHPSSPFGVKWRVANTRSVWTEVGCRVLWGLFLQRVHTFCALSFLERGFRANRIATTGQGQSRSTDPVPAVQFIQTRLPELPQPAPIRINTFKSDRKERLYLPLESPLLRSRGEGSSPFTAPNDLRLFTLFHSFTLSLFHSSTLRLFHSLTKYKARPNSNSSFAPLGRSSSCPRPASAR